MAVLIVVLVYALWCIASYFIGEYLFIKLLNFMFGPDIKYRPFILWNVYKLSKEIEEEKQDGNVG